jgi:transposase InsO family protein
MSETLNEIYHNPNTGYCSVKNLFDQAIKVDPKITLRQVKDWLAGQATYTLHRQARRRYVRNKVLVGGIDEQWQMDLADLSNLQKQNDGFKFILTCIDVFSKYAWAIPLKNKTSSAVTAAFDIILKNGRKPFRLQTDKGTEFLNKDFQKFLKNMHIHFFTTNSETKCAIVERFNRTLKDRMFKYFTENNTNRYVNVLPQLLNAYNNSPHRTIGMPPANVSIKNENFILNKVFRVDSTLPINFKFEIGDTVRISKIKRHFEKGYLPNWTEEVFVVGEKFARNPPVYTLKDLNSDKIEGVFYEPEIQKVNYFQEFFIVEEIVRSRKRKDKTEYLVKWRGYPQKFNSWVTDLKRI